MLFKKRATRANDKWPIGQQEKPKRKKSRVWPIALLTAGVVVIYKTIKSQMDDGWEDAATHTTVAPDPSTEEAKPTAEKEESTTPAEPVKPSSTTPAVSAAEIEVLDLTDKVSLGETAEITIKAKPKTKYTIDVNYGSGPSKAKGLEDKTADSSGTVSWSWTVGGSTSPGTHDITISGNKQKHETKFTVQ